MVLVVLLCGVFRFLFVQWEHAPLQQCTDPLNGTEREKKKRTNKTRRKKDDTQRTEQEEKRQREDTERRHTFVQVSRWQRQRRANLCAVIWLAGLCDQTPRHTPIHPALITHLPLGHPPPSFVLVVVCPLVSCLFSCCHVGWIKVPFLWRQCASEGKHHGSEKNT